MVSPISSMSMVIAASARPGSPDAGRRGTVRLGRRLQGAAAQDPAAEVHPHSGRRVVPSITCLSCGPNRGSWASATSRRAVDPRLQRNARHIAFGEGGHRCQGEVGGERFIGDVLSELVRGLPADARLHKGLLLRETGISMSVACLPVTSPSA
jgi:hypothetical protein